MNTNLFNILSKMNTNLFNILSKTPHPVAKATFLLATAAKNRSKRFLVAAVTDSYYLAMYVTFIAYVFGLAAAVRCRYHDQVLTGFVKTSLPAVGEPVQEIAWETFEHILGPEIDLLGTGKVNDKLPQPASTLSRLVSNPLIKQVDIYDDHLTVEFRTPWDKLKAQKYIGLYPQKHPDRFSPPASEPAQQPTSSHLEGNPLKNTFGKGETALGTDTLVSQAGVTREGGTSHSSLLTYEESRKLHKQADYTDPTQQPHGINELLEVFRAPGSRWLRIPSRDLVSLETSFFRVLSPNGCIAHQINATKQHPQVVTNQARSFVSPLTGYKSDAQPLRTNPLFTQKVNLATLPQSFRLRSYPLPWKVVDLASNGRSPNFSPLIARSTGCRIAYSPNRLDELPYKLGSNQPIGNEVSQLAKSIAKLQAANIPSRAQEVLPSKGGHDSYGLPGSIENNLATHVVSRDGRDGAQTPSPQFVTLSTQGRPCFVARPSLGMAGASSKDNSDFKLQGIVTTYSPLTNSTSFNSLQTSRLDEREEERNLQFSLGSFMSNKELGEWEKAFKEEVVSAFESDVFSQGRRWKWRPLNELLDGLDNEEALPSLIDDSVLLGTGLKADQLTEDNTGLQTDQDGWEDVFPFLSSAALNPLDLIKEISPRVLSGYRYPDLTAEQIRLVLRHFITESRFKLPEEILHLHPFLARKEVRFPPSPSGKMVAQLSAAQLIDNRSAPTNLFPSTALPLAELRYQLVSLKELPSLQSMLSELEAKLGEDAADEILDSTYQGPAIARDHDTNDVGVSNREELAKWIIRKIQGSSRTLPTTQGSSQDLLLPDRQTNLLGEMEVLRGEPLTEQKMLAALRSSSIVAPLPPFCTEGADLAQPGGREASTNNGFDDALLNDGPLALQGANLQPLKGEGMALGKFLDGTHSKLRNGLEVIWSDMVEDSTETPIYPLELFVTKSTPLFEEEQEILALQPEEWDNLLKVVIVESLENKFALDQIEMFLPSIALATQHPAEGIDESRASKLCKPLTSQDYQGLTSLIVQSREFIGQSSRYIATVPAVQGPLQHNAGGEAGQSYRGVRAADEPPVLLCHYLPPAQAAVIQSPATRSIAAATYQKRLTLFTSQHRRGKRIGSDRATGSHLLREAPSRRRVFHQMWEPATSSSWMLLYKLGFAFWVGEMAKDFYQRYGKEMLLYICQLLAALGFNPQPIIEDLGLQETPMKIIARAERRFSDVAGIDSLLPELGEVVWYLRSSGRGGQIPKGILLVGPPGTGKTFVVQAIAGESKVPVIVESASALTDSAQEQSGSQRLRDLFDKARQLSPCILFIDEIDTLGASRPKMAGTAAGNTMGHDDLMESLNELVGKQDQGDGVPGPGRGVSELEDIPPALFPYQHLMPPRLRSNETETTPQDDSQVRPKDEPPDFREGIDASDPTPVLDPETVEILEAHNQARRSQQERLALLMQFLMELDGLRTLRGVIVIGATNRPGVLDPAFTRPGRFERVLYLQLPGKQKRVEILKLYSKNLGIESSESSITWEYLANRTAGLSAAHLAAAMNQSAIRAIIDHTTHTIETVEHGVSVIARRSFQGVCAVAKGPLPGELEGNGAESSEEWSFLELPGYRSKAGSKELTSKESGRAANRLRPVFKAAASGRPSTLARSGYYQAGKAVLQTALPLHPSVAFLPLFPQPFNRASSDLGKIVSSTYQQGLLEPHRRIVLETRLIGLYAGKAGELLALSSSATSPRGCDLGGVGEPNRRDVRPAHSDLGVEELTFAGVVADCMVNSWYLYSKRVALQKSTLGDITRDHHHEIEDPVLLDLFKHLDEELEMEVKRADVSSHRYQKWSAPAWWIKQVMVQEQFVEPPYARWYRVHLPDPKERESNIDWVPPHDYHHSVAVDRMKDLSKRAYREGKRRSPEIRGVVERSTRRKGVVQSVPRRGSAIAWNDLYLISRDYIYYGLINACFYRAFSMLEKRRELLDCFADHLLRYDLIRQYEIDQIAENFGGLEGIVRKADGKNDTGIADAKTQLLEEHQWRKHPATPVIVIHTDQSKEAKAKEPKAPESEAEKFFTTLQPEGPPRSDSLQVDPIRSSVASHAGLNPQIKPHTPDLQEPLPPTVPGSDCLEEKGSSADLASTPSPEGVENPDDRGGGEEPSQRKRASQGEDVKVISDEDIKVFLPPKPDWATIHLVERGWGRFSLKRAGRFVDFDFVKRCFLVPIPSKRGSSSAKE
jgi:ATP-dependent 26S proteasome regulatory subunit